MKQKNITLIDSSDNVIMSCKLTSLPIKEEVILRDSIKYFNDPEPCFIHRSAVMKRIFIEIDDYLNKLIKENVYFIPWKLFSQSCKDVINISCEVYSVKIQ